MMAKKPATSVIEEPDVEDERDYADELVKLQAEFEDFRKQADKDIAELSAELRKYRERGKGAVEVSFAPTPPREGFIATRLDISRMTVEQRIGLHLLTSSLDKSGATLATGKRITESIDAVRWLLEQIAAKRPDGWKPEGY